MHRQKLIDQLLFYQEEQPQKVQQILDFVNNNPRCFQRELQSGHITGSAWLVNYTGDKVLLGLHKKLGMWLQLGGHADGEADVLQVALREAKEESGIEAIEPISTGIFDVDVHLIPARPSEPEHYHYDIRFLLQVTEDVDFKINDEMVELRWFRPEEVQVLEGLDASVLRMARKFECKV